MFEGRRTVAEQAFVSEAVMMAQTNDEAVESAVREHARLIYRIAYSVLRNHHDAEDATQDTFMRVLRYRKRLEGVQDVKMWLARIAWRVAVERGKKRPEISLSEVEMNEAVMQLRSQLASAEESALGNQIAGMLESLITALPEGLRGAMRLSTNEIAEILNTNEASVRSRIFRARKILKEKLSALEGSYGSR